MILAVTGHRPSQLNSEWDMDGPMSNWIYDKIKEVLLKEKPQRALSGFALGVDLIFAKCCIELKIPIDACIPCVGQSFVWPKKSQDLYNEILNNPLVTKVPVYSNSTGMYDYKCMQNRNEYMVDYADKLLCVWNQDRNGGTYNCYKYARSKDKEIIMVDPNDY